MDEEVLDEPINDEVEDQSAGTTEEPEVSEDDKPSGHLSPTFTIAVSEEELVGGFQAPFTVAIAVTEDAKKGDLLKAIVEGINVIKEKFDKDTDVDKYLALYRKWACRTFNLSDRAFSSKDSLKEEVSKVESSVEDALNAQPTVEQMEPVPIIGFGDKEDDEKLGDDAKGDDKTQDRK